jgi:hypothetical protein
MSGNGKKSLQEEYDEAQEALVQAAARLKEASRPKNATRAQVERAAYQDHSELEAELKKARYIRDAKLREFNAQNVATLDPRQQLVNAVESAKATYEQAEKARNVWETKEALLMSKKGQGEHVSIERVDFVRQKIQQLTIPFRKAEKKLKDANEELYRFDHAEELEAERKRRQYVETGVGIPLQEARAAGQIQRDMARVRRQRMQPVEELGGFWRNLGEQIAVEQSPAVLEELNEQVAKGREAKGMSEWIKQQMMDQEQ